MMVSVDTNILFHACLEASHLQAKARAFLSSHAADKQFFVHDMVLEELRALVCNPAVVERPLPLEQAKDLCRRLRENHPGRPAGSSREGVAVRKFWWLVANPKLGFKRVYEARLALILRRAGVTEFATRNVNDFQDFGFTRVWDPLATESRKSGVQNRGRAGRSKS
jgi:predicted nucleic acid-binding protein